MSVNKQVQHCRDARRVTGVGLTAGALAGALALAAAGAAGAQPPPDDCSPSAVMRVHAATMNQMADYLSSNPDVEQVFADARTGATPQDRRSTIQPYLDSHPDVANAIRDMHRPVVDLNTRCGLPMHGGMGPMGPTP